MVGFTPWLLNKKLGGPPETGWKLQQKNLLALLGLKLRFLGLQSHTQPSPYTKAL
jgi:hypothetical protein